MPVIYKRIPFDVFYSVQLLNNYIWLNIEFGGSHMSQNYQYDMYARASGYKVSDIENSLKLQFKPLQDFFHFYDTDVHRLIQTIFDVVENDIDSVDK